jgi:hypothetical protein
MQSSSGKVKYGCTIITMPYYNYQEVEPTERFSCNDATFGNPNPYSASLEKAYTCIDAFPDIDIPDVKDS